MSAEVPRRNDYLLLAALTLLWGINWPIMKLGLEEVPPFWFAAARMAMGAACLFALLAWLGRLRVPPRGDWPVWASVAVFQMALFMGLINLGLSQVEAGRSAVLAYTTPLWVVPVAVLAFGEPLSAGRKLGLALGLVGLLVLLSPWELDWRDPDQIWGHAALLAGAAAWALAILHVRRHRWVSSPLVLAPWQMLGALPFLILIAATTESLAETRLSGELLAVLVFNGPIATAFCFWAAVTLARRLPPITSTVGFLGVPAVGVASAALSLGETLTAGLLLGLALIAGAILAIAKADRPKT